jgi:DNA polymerase-4
VLRRIVHIDMDAFYASVEERDNPALCDRPLAVGYDHPRGVIMTANYAARRYGVGSAMPSRMARERCPELTIVAPRMDVYREASQQIRDVFGRYTDLIEPLALDEAYLDVSEPKRGPPSGTLIAGAVKRDIRSETGLTASAGVSYCKFLAKLASGLDKPDGLSVIEPERAEAFVADLPVERFFGVGPRTAERMHALGVRSGADLRRLDLETLESTFGKHGRHFFHLARAVDERPVEPNRPWRSISAETTFDRDLDSVEALIAELPPLAEHTALRMERAGLAAAGVAIKLKYADHRIVTRRTTLPERIVAAERIERIAAAILRERIALEAPVRLLGVAAFELSEVGDVEQPRLFEVG